MGEREMEANKEMTRQAWIAQEISRPPSACWARAPGCSIHLPERHIPPQERVKRPGLHIPCRTGKRA